MRYALNYEKAGNEDGAEAGNSEDAFVMERSGKTRG